MNRVKRTKKLNPFAKSRSWSDFTRDEDVPLNGTFPYYSDGVAGEKYGNGDYKATNGRLYKVSTSGTGTPLAWYPAPGYRNRADGELVAVGNTGYSWSSASYDSGDHYRGVFLYFSPQRLNPSSVDGRGHGLQLRCLSD